MPENYNLYKKRQHEAFLSAIHRARVTDVHINKGTVNVVFDRLPYSREVTFPLVGLSVPTTEDGGKSSSWGRYIPQEGDMLLVGLDSNGDCFALGYHAVYYQGLTQLDDDNADRGGIGWGEAAGKSVKPGDWDFASSRGCFFYMGDKAQLKSGPFTITLDKTKGDLTTKGQLLLDSYGEGSELRAGGARRQILPTDPSETPILDPTSGGTRNLQEWTNIVKAGSATNPAGLERARYSMGEVISEETYTLMVPATDVTALSALTGTGVRHYRSAKDTAMGVTPVFDEIVDDVGNYGISAPTAVAFQWVTPSATWSVTNATTTITASSAFSVSSPSITLTGGTNASVVAPTVSLGSSTASESLVLGTSFVTKLGTFLGSVVAATTTVGTAPQNAAALTAIGASAQVLLNQLSSIVSTTVFTK